MRERERERSSLHHIMRHFPLLFDWRMWVFIFFRSCFRYSSYGVLWRSDSRTSTKLRKVRIAWRGLIYRDTFCDRFRNRRSLFARPSAICTIQLRHSTVRLCTSLGRGYPGDFSRGVYPLPFVCSTYFPPTSILRSVSLFLVFVAWSCLSVIISRETHVAMIECDVNEFLWLNNILAIKFICEKYTFSAFFVN